MKLKPKEYDVVENQMGEELLITDKVIKHDIGLISQEVYEILPEAVYKPKEEKELWGINYDKFIPVIIKAIQEQQRYIERLEKIINQKDNPQTNI